MNQQPVIIYSVSKEWSNAVIALLRKNGIEASLLHDPDTTAVYKSWGTYKMKVAVPEYQAEKAIAILKDWEEESAEGVDELTAGMTGDLLKIVGGLIFLALTVGVFLWVKNNLF